MYPPIQLFPTGLYLELENLLFYLIISNSYQLFQLRLSNDLKLKMGMRSLLLAHLRFLVDCIHYQKTNSTLVFYFMTFILAMNNLFFIHS